MAGAEPRWREIPRAAEHRPWPLPARPWVMTMSWLDLLFAHWPVPAAALRAVVPASLELDLFEGEAWLGVVPFWMDNVGARGLPYLPGVKRFPELNVRTYVRAAGKPGVFFFSLDATSAFAVAVARATFHLPYFRAKITTGWEEGWVGYASERTHRGAPAGALRGRYRPLGEVYSARPGTLERWLTERYCLYAVDRQGRALRGEIHHAPWPLRRAEAELEVNTVAEHTGLRLAGAPRHLHFVDRIDVVAWLPERV
ncbi:MAG: DUF2071 domain-containing protein [Myxococcales bacterium]|nr:DUF2071 domain-containing protein [Myxococcales bacterium]